MAITTDTAGNLESGVATQKATTVSAANATVTLTLPAPGTGLFIYLVYLEVIRLNPTAAAIAAAATTLNITTTQLGGLIWSIGNALAAGAYDKPVLLQPSKAIKSDAANTAVTVITPAGGAGVLFRINAAYYIAP